MTRKAPKTAERPAEVVHEFGPFSGISNIGGVTFDGKDVWFASGEKIQSLDPATGATGRSLPVRADAGTAFDGHHLFQIAGGAIQKVDPKSGRVVATIPAPEGSLAGLTWAEGTLWVAMHRERKIHQIDATTGAVLRTVTSDRFVTGVSFVDGDLWHGTWENEASDLRRIDPSSGEVLERLTMPAGRMVSGLESDGDERFFCGGGTSGKLRVVRRPKR